MRWCSPVDWLGARSPSAAGHRTWTEPRLIATAAFCIGSIGQDRAAGRKEEKGTREVV